MKTSFGKFLWATVSVLAGLGFATATQAAAMPAPTAPYAVYSFSANCVDCAAQVDQDTFDVRGSLTLQSYTPGNAVALHNLYSLSYEESNRFSAFTVFGFDGIDSNLAVTSDPFPSGGSASVNFFATFSIFLNPENEDRTQIFFSSFNDGTFALGFGFGGPDEDRGNNATWTLTQTVTNDVPEPGSLLLVGAALVAVGVARRRRL